MKIILSNLLLSFNHKAMNKQKKDIRSTAGTSLQGYIDLPYKQIREKVGEPFDGDGYKVDAEWEYQTPYGVATIYNYKDGKNYLGEDGLEVEEITDWHIGGHNKETFEYMKEFLLSDDSMENSIFAKAEKMNLPEAAAVAYLAFVKEGGIDPTPQDFEDRYAGSASSDKEFVEDLLDSFDDITNIPQYIHIDWDATIEDVMQRYWEYDGFYFEIL